MTTVTRRRLDSTMNGQGSRPTAFEEEYQRVFREQLAELSRYGKSMLAGELPSDVRDTLERTVGEKLVSSGVVPKSQLAHFLEARSFGLSSLELSQRGAGVLGSTAQAAYQAYQQEKTLRLQKEAEEQRVALQRSQLDLQRMQLAASIMSNVHELMFRFSRSEQVGTEIPPQIVTDARAILRDLVDRFSL